MGLVTLTARCGRAEPSSCTWTATEEAGMLADFKAVATDGGRVVRGCGGPCWACAFAESSSASRIGRKRIAALSVTGRSMPATTKTGEEIRLVPCFLPTSEKDRDEGYQNRIL